MKYEVRSGDTLYAISKCFHISMSFIVKKKYIAVFIASLFPVFSYASDLDLCIKIAGGADFAMAKCISSEVEFQNKKLNSVYSNLMASIKKDDISQSFRKAELSWIVFRDRSCDIEKILRADGTLKSIIYQQCLLNMTKERILYLQKYASDPDLGDK